jgi:alpha-L-fucosidase 2
MWPQGSVSGLRARGGFEIISLNWKNGHIVKLVIKSTLGANLRLRVPDELKTDASAMHPAAGENKNPFIRPKPFRPGYFGRRHHYITRSEANLCL